MNNYTKKITLNLKFDSEKQATIIALSLKPELQKDFIDIQIDMKQQRSEIIIEFSSLHTSTLRAAINSYIRWIETAYAVSLL